MVRARKGPPAPPPEQEAPTPAGTTSQGAQPIRAPTGMGYGERQALEQAQRDVPLPQAAGTEAAMPDPWQMAEMAAAATPNITSRLDAPSARPYEPIQAGLPLGPGPGPEALPTAPTAAASFRHLAESIKDPELVEIAAIAEALGL